MRRYKGRMSFGHVSSSERRNAELFFAELMGLRIPGARRLGESSEVYLEDVEAAPLALLPAHEDENVEAQVGIEALENVEAQADIEALDAEFAEAPPTTSSSPTVTDTANKDEIIVTRADGTKFHVRRQVHAKVLTRPSRPQTGFCSDDERVFFRVRWCEGTQGTIDLGANVQSALKDLLQTVFKQISDGASPDKIRQTFEDAKVQTFLEVDIAKIGSWKITGDIKLDINKKGVASGSGRLSAGTDWIQFGAEVKVGPDGKQVLVTVDIPLGERKIKGKTCPVRELVVWWDVECLKEVPFTFTLKPPPGEIEEHEKLFLYFDHAKDTLRRDPKAPPTPATTDEVDAILHSEPTVGTARLNKRALERMDFLVGQGYWLVAVDGFASPEGRRPPPKPTDRGLMAKWEGNDALSLERAEKVRKLIADRYRERLDMRISPDKPPVMRFPPDQKMPTGVGHSEKPTLNDKLGRELEGAALDRAIIDGDPALKVKPFLEENPKEAARLTDEDRAFINDTKNTLRKRAERVFENLRRVEICLRHRRKFKETPFQSFILQHERPCPKDLVEAAERKWGPRLPFNRPDPPLCK